MAEKMSIAEARKYGVQGWDLIALIDMDAPEDWTAPGSVHEVVVGQTAYVFAMGRFRRGVVTKTTRTKILVAFTTKGAVEDAERYYGGQGVRVQVTTANLTDVRIAPPAAPAQVVEAAAPAAEVAQATEVELAETMAADVEATMDPADHYRIKALPLPQPMPTAPATGSTVVEALERVWDVIRENHQELPPVVIVTGTGFIGTPRWGHFRANGWTHREHEVQAEGVSTNLRLGEMFVAGETLAKGATHTVETMLHEAVHVLAKVREIQDTSRQNRWHNAKFRTLAGELGMEYEGAQAHPKIGFSEVVLTPGTREDYAPVIDALDTAIRLTVDLPAWLAGTTGQDSAEGASSGGEYISGGKAAKGDTDAKSSNYVKAVCACRDAKGKPEFVIRIARTKLAKAEIKCTICGEYFGAPEDEPADES